MCFQFYYSKHWCVCVCMCVWGVGEAHPYYLHYTENLIFLHSGSVLLRGLHY